MREVGEKVQRNWEQIAMALRGRFDGGARGSAVPDATNKDACRGAVLASDVADGFPAPVEAGRTVSLRSDGRGAQVHVDAVAVALGSSVSEDVLLDIVETSQDDVDRLGLALGGKREELEASTLLGIRVLGLVASSPAPSRRHVRRRARAYGRQRCDAAFATMLALSLERDRKLHGMALRDLA